jgi:hypothetical protein
MMKFLKNRVVLGSALFGILDLLEGFVVASPILIYLRIIYENTESSLRLWPLPDLDLVMDFMLNHNDLIIFYVITVSVLYILFFILKSYFTGGIYRLIIFQKEEPESIGSGRDFLRKSSEIWTGFIKVGLFAIPVYVLAFFLSSIFGGFAGKFSGFLRIIVFVLIFLAGSTYLQILRLHISSTSDTSLKAALAETRDAISKGLLRIFIGNVSVSIVVFVGALIFWFILKALKSTNWNIIIMILTILVQQIMVLTVCLGQTLRINFNYSVIKKGEDNALGGDELG